ncbi:hypothetical protein DID78_07225, partial [Candidatus Marinamargulisbacteria bacterium SCGC AG-343-D04]
NLNEKPAPMGSFDKDELRQIFSEVKNSLSFVLCGPPGSGKTVLIDRFLKFIKQDFNERASKVLELRKKVVKGEGLFTGFKKSSSALWYVHSKEMFLKGAAKGLKYYGGLLLLGGNVLLGAYNGTRFKIVLEDVFRNYSLQIDNPSLPFSANDQAEHFPDNSEQDQFLQMVIVPEISFFLLSVLFGLSLQRGLKALAGEIPKIVPLIGPESPFKIDDPTHLSPAYLSENFKKGSSLGLISPSNLDLLSFKGLDINCITMNYSTVDRSPYLHRLGLLRGQLEALGYKISVVNFFSEGSLVSRRDLNNNLFEMLDLSNCLNE